MDKTAEPNIIIDSDNNNYLYKNLYLYEAYHDFSRSRGNVTGISTDTIKTYTNLYRDINNKFPVANDEDRFIEDIHNGNIYDDNGTQINITSTKPRKSYISSIEDINQYIFRDSGDNKIVIDGELIDILDGHDVIEVFFDYHRENKGKWLQLKTIQSLKAIIAHLYSYIKNDTSIRFLVDTCKLNLAMIYYNTETITNDTIYQIVEESNKWDMASTRKNPNQIREVCVSEKIKITKDVSKKINMNLPVSYTKSKKEFRKISYNLTSENILNPVEIKINYPTEKLTDSLDYKYTIVDRDSANTVTKNIDSFIIVPTNTPNIDIMIGNIVFKDKPNSQCYSTTIIRNRESGNAILLVNPYGYSETRYINSTDDDDIDSDNTKGVLSVNVIKDIIDRMDNYKDFYSKIEPLFIAKKGKNKDLVKCLLFDIKRSGDWSQVLAIHKNMNSDTVPDKKNLVFTTIDRMAFEYARLLKVPAILTSKDFGSDTYRFRMYRDSLLALSLEEREKIKNQLEKQLAIEEETKYTNSIKSEYDQKYNLVTDLINKINTGGLAIEFINNSSDIETIINNNKLFHNKAYINSFIKTIWSVYVKYVETSLEPINNFFKNIDLKLLTKKTNLSDMVNDLYSINSILESFNKYFSHAIESIDTSNIEINIFKSHKDQSFKIQWLVKTLKDCLVLPVATNYFISILDNIDKLFIVTSVRNFKINSDNLTSITQAINSLIYLNGIENSKLLQIPKVNYTNQDSIQKWFETITKSITTLLTINNNSITKNIKSKPVHNTRKRSTRSYKGGKIPDTYKHFLPIDLYKKTTINSIFSTYSTFYSYLIDAISNRNNKSLNSLEFFKGLDGYYSISFKKANSKSLDTYTIEFLEKLFTLDNSNLAKIYIKYALSLIGNDFKKDSFDSALTEQEINDRITLYSKIYEILHSDTSSKQVDDISDYRLSYDDLENPTNYSNQYLELIDNSSDNLTSSMLLYSKDIDVATDKILIDLEGLSTVNRLVLYYLVLLAITDISIHQDSVDNKFAIEPFENFYNDLEALIATLDNSKYITRGGGNSALLVDYLPRDKLISLYSKDIYDKSVINNKPLINNLANKYINKFVNSAMEYIDGFQEYLSKLNTYYVGLITNKYEIETLEIYMSIAYELKQSYNNIEQCRLLYKHEYISIVEMLKRCQLEMSKLCVYHDSAVFTIPNLYSPIKRNVNRDVNRTITENLTNTISTIKEYPNIIDEDIVDYIEYCLEHLDENQVCKYEDML